MSSHEKALKKAGGKVTNIVTTKTKDSKGVKAKLPYKFLKSTGAKDDK